MRAKADLLREQIISTKGHILVKGGPGSGKTTVALKKASIIIQSEIKSEQSVLFLSFSRAAVARLAEASKKDITENVRKQISMQTFHSFCWELLRTHGYLLGAPKTLSVLLPTEEKSLSSGNIESSEWEKEKDKLFFEDGRVAFDEFIPKTIEILNRSTLIKDILTRIYPVIIVDEAQDTGKDAWALVELLSPHVQVLCLADLDQQIFDYLEGVDSERIEIIEEKLKPVIFDLGSDNYRSPNADINKFAKDLITARSTQEGYKDVSRMKFNPKKDNTSLFKKAVAMLSKKIYKETGKKPESIGIFSTNRQGVGTITASLNSGDKPIPHKVLFDETEVILASNFLAFLLEPKYEETHLEDLMEGLQILTTIQKGNGSKTSLREAEKYTKWIDILKEGNSPRKNKMIPTIENIFKKLRMTTFTGDPRIDWINTKNILRQSENELLQKMSANLDYLVAFNRGRRIASKLEIIWQEEGTYLNARIAVSEAITEDALYNGSEDLTGCHVMTIHRSKGKQFDGVIISRENRRIGNNKVTSSFVWRDDDEFNTRSRKILRVGVTRSINHVLIVEPVYYDCPILSPMKLHPPT